MTVAPSLAQSTQDAAPQRTQPELLKAENLVTLDAREAQFKIVAGEGQGRLIIMSLSLAQQPKKWALSFEDLYRLSLTRSSEGAVLATGMELLERNERINFGPAVKLIPARIEAGLEMRLTGGVKIFSMKTGKLAYAGTYTETLREVSRTGFDTPAGTFEGYLVEYFIEINLEHAVIRIDLESGWSNDRKLVHWRTKTTVEKLGLFGDTTIRSLALADKQAEN